MNHQIIFVDYAYVEKPDSNCSIAKWKSINEKWIV